MASFAEEQKIKAHMELIIEDGDYKAYFSQGTNADGVSAWYLTNDSDKAAADSDSLVQVTESSEISTLLTDSHYVA